MNHTVMSLDPALQQLLKHYRLICTDINIALARALKIYNMQVFP